MFVKQKPLQAWCESIVQASHLEYGHDDELERGDLAQENTEADHHCGCSVLPVQETVWGHVDLRHVMRLTSVS